VTAGYGQCRASRRAARGPDGFTRHMAEQFFLHQGGDQAVAFVHATPGARGRAPGARDCGSPGRVPTGGGHRPVPAPDRPGSNPNAGLRVLLGGGIGLGRSHLVNRLKRVVDGQLPSFVVNHMASIPPRWLRLPADPGAQFRGAPRCVRDGRRRGRRGLRCCGCPDCSDYGMRLFDVDAPACAVRHRRCATGNPPAACSASSAGGHHGYRPWNTPAATATRRCRR
jgi:hypothetical protein